MLLRRGSDRMDRGSVGACAYLDARDRALTISFLFGGGADA